MAAWIGGSMIDAPRSSTFGAEDFVMGLLDQVVGAALGGGAAGP